jgi:hypothetical protein
MLHLVQLLARILLALTFLVAAALKLSRWVRVSDPNPDGDQREPARRALFCARVESREVVYEGQNPLRAAGTTVASSA